MNAYAALREKHQNEVNAFPLFFAFSNKQFEEGMTRFGLSPDETDKIYRLSGTGGYYLRTDADRLHEMFDRHERERQEALADDPKGEGYIYQMFLFELQNHEYGYTWELDDTLDALGLTMEDVENSKALSSGHKKAIAYIKKAGDCFGGG